MAGGATARRFFYVLRRVLFSPQSAVLWTAAVLGSAWMGWSPVPILAGLGLQVALFYWRLHDEEYLRRIFRDQEEAGQTLSESSIEEMLAGMDFETRQRLRYIMMLQKEIEQEARAGDVQPYARGELQRIVARLPGLVTQAVRIAARKQQLNRYLTHVDERALSAYAENLRARIEATTDPVARRQYEQALKAREAELGTYRAIAQASARIDSQLENVEATFASWKARVIRLKTVDIGNVTSFSDDLIHELETLGSEIELLDNSVMEALAPEATVTAARSSGGGL